MLVLCNGMPRSGSTLQYNMVGNLVEAAGTGAAHGGMEDTGGTEDDLRVAATSETTAVYKTHEVLPHIVPWIERGDAGVFLLYIHRDLRDVAVSIREKHGPNVDQLLSLLDSSVAAYNTLLAIRESPYVLWQRYEDVMADPRAATLEAADLLGLCLPPEVVDVIAAECSVASARKVMDTVRRAMEHSIARATPSDVRQIRRGLRNGSFRAADPATLIHWNHISRFGGASGVWRRELPAPLLATITDRYADWFESAGYDLEDENASAAATATATRGAAQ